MDANNEYRLVSWLAQQEDQYKITLYQCDSTFTLWTQRCVRQADCILVVGLGKNPPSVSRVLSILISFANFAVAQLHPTFNVFSHIRLKKKLKNSQFVLKKNWYCYTTKELVYLIIQSRGWICVRGCPRIITSNAVNVYSAQSRSTELCVSCNVIPRVWNLCIVIFCFAVKF